MQTKNNLVNLKNSSFNMIGASILINIQHFAFDSNTCQTFLYQSNGVLFNQLKSNHYLS